MAVLPFFKVIRGKSHFFCPLLPNLIYHLQSSVGHSLEM
jgi:hypothetical protein